MTASGSTLLDTVYHVPTAYVIASLVFLIIPSLTGFTLRGERSQAVRWWISGGLLISAGLMALGLRQTYPGLVPFNTGFTLVMLGEALHLHALDRELGRAPRLRLWLGLALGTAALKELLYRAWPQSEAHYLMAYASLFLVLLVASLQARQIARTEGLRSAVWLGRFSLLAALAFGARALTGLMGLSAPEALNNQVSGVLTTLVVVAVALVDNFAIIGVYLERSQRRNAQLVMEEERARAAAELTAQVAHLDRQRSMGELAASLAHELGQPITGILLDASTLEQGLQQVPQRTQELAGMTRNLLDQAQRARQILEGIRNFMQPSRQSLARLHLPEVIEGAQRILQPDTRGRDIRITVHCQSPSPWVQGDVVQLSQVFLNLLRNSIQAQRPRQALHIEVMIREAGKELEVVLEDDGQGMNPEQLARSGTAFFSTKPDGLGVGLAICRRILEHHGGSLTLAHAASGQGLRTTLRLPLASPPA